MALTDKAMTIVVFVIFLNAVPGLLVSSGVAEDMGVDISIGGDTQVQEANQAADSIEPSGGFGQTLFTLYTSLGGTLQAILGLVIGGELLFLSLGVPEWLVAFVFAPKYIVVGATLIYVLAGRRL